MVNPAQKLDYRLAHIAVPALHLDRQAGDKLAENCHICGIHVVPDPRMMRPFLEITLDDIRDRERSGKAVLLWPGSPGTYAEWRGFAETELGFSRAGIGMLLRLAAILPDCTLLNPGRQGVMLMATEPFDASSILPSLWMTEGDRVFRAATSQGRPERGVGSPPTSKPEALVFWA